ncbi:NAD(P)-dependent oxidoreductase [Tabrizicola sp.]|uniref:NAD(P)-dependent oxidoreductase n=1 Tax=Tabrizicola sp. TaxID=2005166 RepID=UPI003F390D4F
MKIGFLGLGAMGSRMAARLVAAGHEVTVWNRTPRPLVGAMVADTPDAAAFGAEVVISSLRDDAASAAVWGAALPTMAAGAVGIETSTISPDAARALHGAAAARGVAFLDAPVAGSRPQAEAGQLIFMAGGEPEVLARVEPLLLAMGGAVHHAGGPGAGAAVKLMVNSLFAAQVAAMAELIGLAQTKGIDPARAVEILGATPVASPAVKGAAAAMLAGNFAPAFPIDLVAKDLDIALGTGATLPVTRLVADVFQAAIAEGLAKDNITGIVQRYFKR